MRCPSSEAAPNYAPRAHSRPSRSLAWCIVDRDRRDRCLVLRSSPLSVQHLRLGSVRFHRSDERILDLFLYRPQPLLSAGRTASETLNLSFQFPDPIFGTSQLKREPMRHSHCSLDVVFRDVRCFFEQTNEGVPGLINRF
jgi:hypothetical protein